MGNIDRGAGSDTRQRRALQRIKSALPPALPEQTGHAGEYLTTDGTTSSWVGLGLATVATSGLASDLNLTGFTLSTTHISGLATVATTGAYSDLTGKPSLATVATTGAYSDLTGKPTLATVATTGAYNDLIGKPTLASVATSGAYADLSGLPTLTVMKWVDITDSNFIVGNTGVEVDFDRQVTLAANTLKNNSILKVRFSGLYSNSGNPSVTYKFYFGGTLLLTLSGASLTGQTNSFWVVDITIYCVTAGATATIRAEGMLTYRQITSYFFTSGNITVDTTASNLVKLSATWAVTTASDTIHVQQAYAQACYS